LSLTSLPTAVLGRTGLEVTRLGYGTAPRKHPDDEQWGRILNGVLDSGINFIDTANDYGVREANGPAEEQMGRHIQSRRSEYYLATKCGCAPGGGHTWTRENAFRGLEESLARMKTDYVDIMQLHNPTVEECEKADLVKALQDMREQGKVRWIGVSTTLPHLPTYLEWGVFDVFQIPYSALERDHEEWITTAAEAGIGIIIRGGVARGEPGVGSRGESQWQMFEKAGLDELREEGESRTSLILRYTLSHPRADTNIVGTGNLDHLTENVEGILRGPLSAEEYAEAKRRLYSAGSRPA
jgi:aryl-alcohol dehydrogenase-like predicted oxidoreductase